MRRGADGKTVPLRAETSRDGVRAEGETPSRSQERGERAKYEKGAFLEIRIQASALSELFSQDAVFTL